MSGILSIGNFSATSGINSLGDASINRRLFVGSDVSFGGGLFVTGDVKGNGNFILPGLNVNIVNTYIASAATFGQTWNASPTYTNNGYLLYGLSISSTGKYQIFHHSSNGQTYSSDFGQTFSVATKNSFTFNLTTSAMSSSGQYAVGTNNVNGVAYSSDYGQTWNQSTISFGSNSAGYICMSGSGQYCLFGAGAPGANAFVAIWRSTDYGQNWSAVNIPGTIIYPIFNYMAISSTGQYAIATLRKAGSGNTQGILYSSNYGANWTQSSSLTTTNMYSAAMSSNGMYCIAGPDSGGIYYSSNYGQTWTNSDKTAFGSMYLAMNGTGQFCLAASGAGSGLMYYSVNYGQNWTLSNLTTGVYAGICISKDATYAVTLTDNTAVKGLFIQNNPGVVASSTNVIDVSSSSISSDISANSRLFVALDVSFGGKLFTIGDLSLNGNVGIGNRLIVGNGISVTGSVTLPVASLADSAHSANIVTLVGSQTLTNKTLTTPIISSISNSGTITVPTGTLTLATLTGSETLTNKTLTTPIISSISNSGTITVPTGTLTLATLTGSETLTNKTLTTPIISSISNSGTITVPTGTLTLATLTGSETLTNKTLTTPIISSISNSGTITFPTGTLTLATLTGAETMTNKTLTTSGFLTALSDASFNQRLYVGTDASFGGRLFVQNDSSMNGNLSIAKDMTIGGNLYVKTYTTQQTITELSYQLIVAQDISVNGRLFLSNDASINRRLYVGGDASMSGRLFVVGDVSLNGNVFVTTQLSSDNSNKVATTAYVKSALSSGGSTYFATDVSFGNKIFVISDISVGGQLLVSGNLVLPGLNYVNDPPVQVVSSASFGQSWTSIPSASLTDNWYLAVTVSNDKNYLMGFGRSYISYSLNSGQTWANSTYPNSANQNASLGAMSSSGQYGVFLMASGSYAEGFGKTFYTSNYGQTWTQSSASALQVLQYAPSVSSSGQYCILGTYGGGTDATIWRSTNYGVDWNNTNYNPAANTYFTGSAISSTGKYAIISDRSGGIYYSSDFGVNWAKSNALSVNKAERLAMSSSGQYCIAGSAADKGIQYSNDFGNTWIASTLTLGTWAVSMDATGAFCIATSQLNGNTGTSRSNGVIYSTNYGQTWTASTITSGDFCCKLSNNGFYAIIGATDTPSGARISIYLQTNPTVPSPAKTGSVTVSGPVISTDISANSRLSVASDASFGGKLYVAGTLTKGGGSFDIVHPDPSKSETTRLRHCFVEAPTRGDNIYRYKISTMDLSASFTLPSYYKFLNEDTQIWVNPVNCLGSGYGVLQSDNETVQIKVSHDGLYNILIIGTRKDQMMIDFFDNNGGVEYSIR